MLGTLYSPQGMRALPVPKHGGKVATLRKYLNVASDDDFVLIVSGLLSALRGHGPYVILDVTGEAGSGEIHLAGNAAQSGRPEQHAAAGSAA